MVVLKTSPKCQTMECLHQSLTTYVRSLHKRSAVSNRTKCQTMECLHSNWMTYGRSLPKEFRKHFEKACKELNIKLYVLPPYSPKQNGRIEAQSRKMMCLSYRFAPIVLRQTLGLKPLVGDLK